MTIADQLKKLRREKEFTVSHIARQLRVSESTYRDWENGRQIKGEPYLQIAKIFGVSLSELFLGEIASSRGMRKDIQAIEEILHNLRLKL